jgi:hypothetical protein
MCSNACWALAGWAAETGDPPDRSSYRVAAGGVVTAVDAVRADGPAACPSLKFESGFTVCIFEDFVELTSKPHGLPAPVTLHS